MTRDERIHAVALAIVTKRYPHVSREDHVQLALNRRDEAAAALDAADKTRDVQPWPGPHPLIAECNWPGCACHAEVKR